ILAQLEQWQQLTPDELAIEPRLTQHDSSNIGPVFVATRECLVNHKILGGARGDRFALRDHKSTRALDGVLLKWHRAERDVHVNTVARHEEKRSMPECELASVSNSAAKRRQQGIDILLLAAKSGDDS